jgi:transcriptional regulator with XRE-family HTH domain
MVAAIMPRETFGFAARLRALRNAAGLTQVELAERSGVLLTSLTKLEAGTHAPNWPTAVKLARALGVSLDQFVGEGGEPTTPPARPRGRPRRMPAEERAQQPPPAPPSGKKRRPKGGA